MGGCSMLIKSKKLRTLVWYCGGRCLAGEWGGVKHEVDLQKKRQNHHQEKMRKFISKIVAKTGKYSAQKYPWIYRAFYKGSDIIFLPVNKT